MVKPELIDNDLLKGLAEGDRKSIELIYKSHFNMIQTLVINNSGSSDDARDIFQEALVVLYEKVQMGSFELNCQLKTYLYSVCKRLWLKRLQQNSRYVTPDVEVELTVSVEEDMAAHEKRDADYELMNKAIGNLGEPCKSLLEAYYINKMNMQDIASQFGYTNADNAKNQKYKCLMRLKKIFFTQYKNGNENG
ncbi:MAG TPA: RNA polymerase subunit sigma-70 [Chitinophagaceae bacterium]|nr:sigma-70 family RNA polymerase sigma factor [Chitinophagaceae bacterium]NCW87685.1 sigma-70 family RNA polymerase sigma factor [Chitinophagia bacterium]HAL95356.1 RNA polymerase subunit sigma-70 [Chitinophagaceae bacterium]